MVYPAIEEFKVSDPNFIDLHDDFYCSSHSTIQILQLFYTSAGDLHQGPIPNTDARTADLGYIDAVIFTNNPNKLHDATRIYIILLGGNCTCYENHANQLMNFAQNNYIAISFNPMGVGYSTGITNGPNDYMRALEIVIDNLLKHGIPAQNIILQGHSFGAAIATVTAEKYQTKNQRIKLINDRSFAELAQIAATLVYSEITNKYIRYTLGIVIYYFVSLLIRALSLNINPGKSFAAINRLNPGDALCVIAGEDEIIPDNCSIDRNINSALAKLYCKRFWSTWGFAHNISLRSLHAFNEQNCRPLRVSVGDTAEEYIQSHINKFAQDAVTPIAVAPVIDDSYRTMILNYFSTVIRSLSTIIPRHTEDPNLTPSLETDNNTGITRRLLS